MIETSTRISAEEVHAAVTATDDVPALALLHLLRGVPRIPITEQTITKAETDAVADRARHMPIIPADPRYTMPNPLFPAQPAAPLDAPGIDCALIDAGLWEPAAPVVPLYIEPKEMAA